MADLFNPYMNLKDWRTMNRVLCALSETEVNDLLQAELKGRQRGRFLERLHQRFCTLRSDRERLEILKHAK